jgi:outer membrane protein assembly factor BamB
VGGGNEQVYALNALTGTILWQHPAGNYLWSSPLVANGSVYIGTASLGDCPNIHGQLLQLDAVTGTVLHTFDVVPVGCTGGSIWGSPTLDPVANLLYFATGNPGTCGTTERNAEAVVQLNATTLAPIASWQVPSSQRTGDGDFGSTPTLFQATIGGTTHTLVGVANKNGRYYALDAANIAHGPVWEDKIAIGGSGPEKGQGSISPSAWDGATLYVAGGNTTINGVKCKGSLRAVNPATGTYVWQACLAAPVLAAVSAVPGVAIVDAGTALTLVATATGKTLFTFKDTASGSHFWGPAAVVGGVIYQGNMDGALYAIGT